MTESLVRPSKRKLQRRIFRQIKEMRPVALQGCRFWRYRGGPGLFFVPLPSGRNNGYVRSSGHPPDPATLAQIATTELEYQTPVITQWDRVNVGLHGAHGDIAVKLRKRPTAPLPVDLLQSLAVLSNTDALFLTKHIGQFHSQNPFAHSLPTYDFGSWSARFTRLLTLVTGRKYRITSSRYAILKGNR